MSTPSVIPGNNLEDLDGVATLKYWNRYLLICKRRDLQPSLSDYMVWMEEKGLIKSD